MHASAGTVVWQPRAERALRRLRNAQLEEAIKKEVDRYTATGHGNVLPVKSLKNRLRLRYRYVRVIFEQTGSTVIIHDLDKREDAY